MSVSDPREEYDVDEGDASSPPWIWVAIAVLAAMLALADSQCGLDDGTVDVTEEPHPMY